jgi:hypothetical protein
MKMLCTLWALAAAGPCAMADMYSDSSVKAAFVLRFAGYVEWPREAVPERQFVIAVLGNGDIAEHLQRLAADRVLHGRAVQVRRITAIEEARGAQILYVGSGQQRRLRAGRKALANSSVLIVSDLEQGLASGSMINFLLADNRVRFEVSLDAARRANLRISADLLSVAAKVTE